VAPATNIGVNSLVYSPAPNRRARLVTRIEGDRVWLIRTDRKGPIEGPFALADLTTEQNPGPMRVLF
jgi:hypothetical protein